MSDPITMLASETGLDEGQVQNGLAATLQGFKEKLPDDLFGHVQALFPKISPADAPTDKGGLMGSIAGMASKAIGDGGGAAADLLGKLGAAGLSMDQIKAFVPKVLAFLQDHLPAGVMEKIKGHVPGLDSVSG